MALLLRVSLVWIGLGLVVGFILRRRVPGQLSLLLGVSALPVLAHAGYIIMYTLSERAAGTLGVQLGILVVLSIMLVALSLLTWRFVRESPARAPLIPLALTALYALPLLWFSTVLRTQAIGLDAIPTVVLVCATLFMSSVLFAYTFARSGDTLERRRRR